MKTVLSEQQIYIEFGKCIKYHRELQTMSQTDLAGKLGISQSMVCRIESGERKVDLGLAIKLCDAVKLDIRDFARNYL